MNIAALHIQLAEPVVNAIGSLQGAGKLVPRASKHAPRSSRRTRELEESMRNTLVNCADLRLLTVPLECVTSPLLSRSPPPRAPLPPHWRQSYVPAASFGLPLPAARRPLLLLRAVLVPAQRRGFKTQRTVDQERVVRPSVADRLRDTLLLSRRGEQPEQPTVAAATPGKNVATGTAAKLKELSDQSTPVEQQRLKVAFAEGYMSGGERRSRFGRVFDTFYRILTFGVLILFAFVLATGPGSSMFRMPFSPNEVAPEDVDVTFADVRGADEAKQELVDIVAYLRDPVRFSALGGKLPKGVLLTGKPGLGKTLLARAVAGEANVPFFHASGSEFDEIFVGQGARRVRDLFRTAKARAPCVLFIDEIDSVGGKRSGSRHHPYANQTINQLLSEMDGFHSNEGVIVLGATNRRDHLDSALLRPGRFDVEVVVQLPDVQGRKDIFHLYLDRVRLGDDVDVEKLAKLTVGFTGAEIENMVNQAALRAALMQATSVCMKHLEWSLDKVVMGVERKERLPDEESNQLTAWHEGGHTLVAYFTEHAKPVHKVTIMPRGQSLGHTSLIPSKDQYTKTRAQLLAELDVMMGGRVAEQMLRGPEFVTSGASSDLQRATDLAAVMVKQYGMSDKAGLRIVPGVDSNSWDSGAQLSDNTIALIDVEITRLLNEAFERAKALLQSHRKELQLLADALVKYETLDGEDIATILRGEGVPGKSVAYE